jgi:hypothetical protein
MAALTPPGKAATLKKRWLGTVVAYTAGGTVTSLIVGAALGWLGSVVGLGRTGSIGLAVAAAIALVAAARETGVLSVPLPQARRATKGTWATMGLPLAATLWGLDIGLFATTWLTFAGAWLVPALALLGGSVAFGAALFAAYWAGRALSVWVAPAFMVTAADTLRMMDALEAAHDRARVVHVAALGWGLVVFGVMAASSVSL